MSFIHNIGTFTKNFIETLKVWLKKKSRKKQTKWTKILNT